jgi:hypothetical protein
VPKKPIARRRLTDRGSRRFARHASRAVAIVAATLLLALPCGAQVLYKLTDRQGKVSYVDVVPKGFDGEVMRIEPDEKPTQTVPRPTASRPAPTTINDVRVANREALESQLRAARERYAAASKAKAEGGDVKPEEFQPVQKRYPLPRSGEAAPRANCLTRNDSDGSSYLICPYPVPNDEHYARLKAIDEELRLAQEALEVAERNYRRGVD